MINNNEIITGLDLGQSKTAVVVGRVAHDGVHILGIGSAPTQGFSRGQITNMESAAESIRRAVREAQVSSGQEIDSVYVSIAGQHILGLNGQGYGRISSGEVDQADIDQAVDSARTVAIPLERKILHIIPQEFKIDDQEGIKNPLGMSGGLLEVKAYVITGGLISTPKLLKTCEQARLQVNELVLDQLAAAESVLSLQEKQQGVILIEMGGGLTKVAIYADGVLVHAGFVMIGGRTLTDEVAIGLRIPLGKGAEQLKLTYGLALRSNETVGETFTASSVRNLPDRKFPLSILTEIIKPRALEILGQVKQQIEQSGYGDQIAAGVVLCGGGARLRGFQELTAEILEKPVRIGLPQGFQGREDLVSDPAYATAVGLVLRAAKGRSPQEQRQEVAA